MLPERGEQEGRPHLEGTRLGAVEMDKLGPDVPQVDKGTDRGWAPRQKEEES